jgi:hypothetical protein
VSRRAVVILIVVLAVAGAALVALAVVPGPSLTAIETKAVGDWSETGSPKAYRLYIGQRDRDRYGAEYAVACSRLFRGWLPADREGDELHIWGENTKDVMWIVTYEEARDTITLTRPQTGQSHTFRRSGFPM